MPSTPAPITTPAGHIVHANPVLCALMGRGVEELATASVFDLIHPDDREAVRRACDRLHASATGISEYQVRLRHSEGRVLHTRVSASLALGTAGTPSYRILHIEDVTEPRLLRARLAHQALHDPLTGLPNRALFTDRLTHALARTRREPADLAVLFLNLDRFKAINDAHGHATGDHVLATLARRLPPLLRPADTAARFGGDEFVLLCVGADARHAGDIATRIGAALAEPVPLPQGEVVLTASIGVVTARGGAHPDGLIADADAAMYQAKQSGRARYELCTASLRSRATERLARETALRIGIAHDQLRLHYQPEITLTTGARGRGVLGRRLPPLNGVGPCAPGDRARLRV